MVSVERIVVLKRVMHVPVRLCSITKFEGSCDLYFRLVSCSPDMLCSIWFSKIRLCLFRTLQNPCSFLHNLGQKQEEPVMEMILHVVVILDQMNQNLTEETLGFQKMIGTESFRGQRYVAWGYHAIGPFLAVKACSFNHCLLFLIGLSVCGKLYFHTSSEESSSRPW